MRAQMPCYRDSTIISGVAGDWSYTRPNNSCLADDSLLQWATLAFLALQGTELYRELGGAFGGIVRLYLEALSIKMRSCPTRLYKPRA